MEEYEGPSSDAQNEDLCLVIANDDDLEICVPFLDQGFTLHLGNETYDSSQAVLSIELIFLFGDGEFMLMVL